MAYSKIESEVLSFAEASAEKIGYEIYDLEFVKEGPNRFLRIFIDRDEGVAIDDCEAVSREVSAYLDSVDIIEDNYFLEVSSPGLERTLRLDKHYASAVGKEIHVKLFKAVGGVKELEGILTAFDKDAVTIDSSTVIQRRNITKANIVFNY